jgi:hypothetical protein
MKKITGLLAILAAAAAFAAPAMARDWDDYGCAGYNARPVYGGYATVRRDVRVDHNVRRDVRPVRGGFDRR